MRSADLRDLPLYVPGSRLYESHFSGWLGYPFDSLNIAGTYTLLHNASFLACAGAGVLCIDGIVEPKPTETFLPLDPPMPVRAAVAWLEARPKKMLTEAFIALLRQRIAAAAPD